MPTGLTRRGGRYYLRRRVPLDLVLILGRAEIVKALGTSDFKIAKRKLTIEWHALTEEFERLSVPSMQAVQPDVDVAELPSPTLVSLAQVDHLREQRDAALSEGRLAEFIQKQRDTLIVTQAMLDGLITPIKNIRELEGIRNGIRAFLDGTNALTIAAARQARALPRANADNLTIAAMIDRWAAENSPTVRTLRRTRNIAARFEAATNVSLVARVTRQSVLDFKSALQSTSTPANTNVMLGMLGTVFNYAVRNDLININPVKGISVTDKRRAKDIRREFGVSELNALFSSLIYTEENYPKAAGGYAGYWLPLLGLFTGARLTELGQLHPEDIFIEQYPDLDGSIKSTWVMRIVADETRSQRIKNEGSERRIPLHKSLVDLGFLEVVKAAKRASRARIFYEIEPTANNELMGNWSKWFGRYRRTIPSIAGDKTPFHAFRHSFKHYARLSGIPSEVHDAITGHESGRVADNYGGLSFPLPPLVEAIGKYTIPGLKLPNPSMAKSGAKKNH